MTINDSRHLKSHKFQCWPGGAVISGRAVLGHRQTQSGHWYFQVHRGILICCSEVAILNKSVDNHLPNHDCVGGNAVPETGCLRGLILAVVAPVKALFY